MIKKRPFLWKGKLKKEAPPDFYLIYKNDIFGMYHASAWQVACFVRDEDFAGSKIQPVPLKAVSSRLIESNVIFLFSGCTTPRRGRLPASFGTKRSLGRIQPVPLKAVSSRLIESNAVLKIVVHFLNIPRRSFATLAQLVEQRIRNAWVGSSSLLGGSIKSRFVPADLLFYLQHFPRAAPVNLVSFFSPRGGWSLFPAVFSALPRAFPETQGPTPSPAGFCD